jgi:predicted amidophosphoribosyltransferase
MQDFQGEIAVADACPMCQADLEEGDLFCGRCGSSARGENAIPEALNLPVVHLLTQVCTLQKDLVRQFRNNQALQARQLQRAMEVQSSQLELTLAHATTTMELQERRLQALVRWTAILATSASALIFIAIQVL